MEIHYLDNAATTKPKFFAKDYDVWANANTPYGFGLEAHKFLKDCRNRVKAVLGVKTGKVVFGGTTSQLIDCLMQNCYRFGGIFVSDYEHDSISAWSTKQFDTMPTLKNMLEPEWIERKNDIVCQMLTNNLTGQNFPVQQTGNMCHDHNAFFLCDLTASIGHTDIPDNLDEWCDCVVASAHKFHGPQGTGFMWLSDKLAEYLGLSDDSHEEYGLVSGTPAVMNVLAMTDALEDACQCVEGKNEKWCMLMSSLTSGLWVHDVENERYGGLFKTCAINALTLPGINADALQQFLSTRGVYVGIGHSACAGKADYRVLQAYDYTPEQASQTIRVSFDEDTSYADIEALVDGIVEFKKRFC